MIAFTRRTALLLAASSLLATALAATDGHADPADGTASGTLTVNGKVTPVAYATARQVPGFFDKSSMDTEVIVSDVPLDAQALGDPFVRGDLAAAGKLHAFEIVIDAAGTPVSTAWRDNGFKGAPAPSGLSSADPFVKSVLDGKVAAGSYKSAEPAEFFGNTYAFDVTFRAVVAP
ncbi:hypothetical protein [Dongia sedimenti]|uniref:Uncharacterized protein n=1 Tax=Dongia sedimenti TaxID=3064282 RepID=A0ABU0YSH5_9PROT|nr:hypothetical protein [Rhodospirillaceae bacterium R-7]